MPCSTCSDVGDAERVKLGGGFTVSASVVLADKFPEVPVMVRLTAPVAAVLDALKVSLLELLLELGLNAAVTPLGRPEMASDTLPLNPPASRMAMVVLALDPPCTSVRLRGDAVRVKLCATFTVSESGVLADKLPEVPVMVTLAVPVVAVLDADRVSTLEPVVELGLKDAVTPLGSPETESATLPLNPP